MKWIKMEKKSKLYVLVTVLWENQSMLQYVCSKRFSCHKLEFLGKIKLRKLLDKKIQIVKNFVYTF